MPKPSLEDELKILSQHITNAAPSDDILTLPDFLQSFGFSFDHVNKDYGIPPELGLGAGEIEAIRVLHDTGELVEALSFDFNITEDQVQSILDGTIGPYAGGPFDIRKPKTGPHPDVAGPHLNDKLFCAGIVAAAKELLNPIQLDIFYQFCKLDGKAIAELGKYFDHDSHPEQSFERYRDFLRRNAESQKAQRARVTKRTRPANPW